MEPFPFTPADYRHVYDFKVVASRRRAVPINRAAKARAFIAVDIGEVRIYEGYFSFHSIEPKILANESGSRSR